MVYLNTGQLETVAWDKVKIFKGALKNERRVINNKDRRKCIVTDPMRSHLSVGQIVWVIE